MEILPKIDNLPERHVAFVSYTGNFMANPKVFEDLFGKLCGWAGPKGLLAANAIMLSSYQDDPKITPPEKLTVDVCLVISDNINVEGMVQKKILPGGRYVIASVELSGPQEYGSTWEAVMSWARDNNFQMDISRPSYEIYKNDPKSHPQGHHILDICLAVKDN